jgi:hypothetical protein
MTISLRLWLPLSLLAGWALGQDTSWNSGSAREKKAMPVRYSQPAEFPEGFSPRSQEGLQRGERLLAEALRRKRWGDAQAEELRRLLPELPMVQQQRLTQRLLIALNRGDLSVETTGLPF